MGNRKKLVELVLGEDQFTLKNSETNKRVDVKPVGIPIIIYIPMDCDEQDEHTLREIKKNAPLYIPYPDAYTIGGSVSLRGKVDINGVINRKSILDICGSFFPVQYYKIEESKKI